MGAERTPFFSVVVPVRDGGAVFERCLEALRRSSFTDFELIVVDDGSVDGSAAAARRGGARVLATGGGRGPAAARNLGAGEAGGEYLLFVDADCEVRRDTLERAAAILASDPGLDALFGSYDDRPAAPGLVSQFKNLLHHYVHQRAAERAATFWAGCGAVRRSVFLEHGGFDAARYPRPSIEDIELGYRLSDAGHRIRLAREVQVTHHKRWTLISLVRTDLLDRAIPWTRLGLARRGRARELNLDLRGRSSVALATLTALGALLAPLSPWTLAVSAATAAAVTAINLDVLRFLARRRGLAFGFAALPLLFLYYLYCAAGYAAGWVLHLASGGRPAPRGPGTSPGGSA